MRSGWIVVWALAALLAAGCSDNATNVSTEPPVIPVLGGDASTGELPEPAPDSPDLDTTANDAEPSATPRPTAPSRVESEIRIATGTVEPVATPTPDIARNDELIAAARATFEAGRGNTSVVWDYVGAEVITNRLVRLRICAWGGDTIHDQVLDLNYRIETPEAVDDPLVATYLDTSPTAEQCLNTSLIASAFAFIGQHDSYWAAIIADPASFDRASASGLLAPSYLDRVDGLVQGWIDDELRFEGRAYVGDLPASAVRNVLWRRYESQVGEILAVLACRPMQASYATFQAGERIDQPVAGPHSVIEYRLTRQGDRWLMAGGEATVGADCTATPDWATAVNAQAEGSAEWRVFEG